MNLFSKYRYKSVLLFGLAIATSCWTPQANAVNEYFVKVGGSGTACTQAAPCGSITQASKTLTLGSAVTFSTSGTFTSFPSIAAVIHVAPGTYNECVVTQQGSGYTTHNGTASQQILIVSDTQYGAKVVCNNGANGVIWQNGTGGNANGQYVTVYGFDVSGNSCIGIRTDGSNFFAAGNLVHDVLESGTICTNGGAGINLGQTGNAAPNDSHNSSVIGNIIDNIGVGTTGACLNIHGIYPASEDFVVQNNIVSRACGWGIQPFHLTQRGVITNNVVINNRNGGILVSASDLGEFPDHYTVNNNIVAHNGGGENGVEERYGNASGPNSVYNYDVVWSNSNTNFFFNWGSRTNTGTVIGSDSTTFVNYTGNARTGDYHLKTNIVGVSTCASGGITPCVRSTDFTGAVRSTNAPSVGVYEFAGSTSVSSLVANPTTLSFGTVPIGVDSAVQTTTVTNNGNVSVTLGSATIGGTNSGDFLFGGIGTCANGQVLAPAASCTVSIKFHPLAAGARSGNVSQASSATNSPAVVTLTGTGGAPAVSLTPTTFDFGSIQVGTASATHTFVLQNTGTAPLTFTISTSVAAFTQSNNCTSPLAVSASCNIAVTFQPSVAGAQSGLLTVTSNASTSPNTSALSGTGTAPPGLTLSPTSINFANTLVNSYSPVTNVTVTNPGATAITINSVTVTGANSADFIAGACSTSTTAFTDNFSSGSLDLTKWQIDTGGAPGTITGVNAGSFSSSNIDLSQGVLGLKVVQSGASPVTSVGAEIRALNAFGFGSYRWRMRAASTATSPYATGSAVSGQISSTFALNSSSANPYTEIDAPEIEGQHPSTIEWTTWTTPALNTEVSTTLANPEAAFHTYRYDWQASSVAFRLDGSLVATNSNNIPSAAANPMTNIWGTNSTSFGGLATIGTRWMYVAGFAFTPAGLTSIPAGGTCTVPVIFNPATAGTKAATLSISDTATGSPHQASLAGLATSAGASIGGSPLSFGNQPVGTTSAAQNLTLANLGNGPMYFSIALTGTNPGDFILSTTSCVSPLAGGQSCLIPLKFSPTTSGARSATVTVTDSASGSPHTGTVTGTGTALTVTISPSTLSFPDTTVGVTSSAIVATLTNTGNTTLNIASKAVTGDYAISASTCGATLAAGLNCTVSVTFTPTALGTRSGTLTFTDDAIASPQSIFLTGGGTAATTPVVLLSPGNLDFGNQVISTLSSAQVVTLTNTGTATLNMVRTISGDYSISATTCGATLGTSASCTVSVKFTPTALGTRTGLLTFTDDASGSPQTVSLTGNGVSAPAPIASISPSSRTFASQTVGTTSASQAITLQNTGNATLNIASILASGDYAISSTTCGATLAAAASCVVNVTFTPTATGTRIGAIAFTDDAAGSPQSVSLTGTGIAPTAPVVSLSVTSLTFASQTTGTTSAAQSVTLTNTGNATLNITSITPSGDFAIASQTCASTLLASTSCSVSITFTPTATGTRSGSLTFVDNAAGSPHTVSLSGTGAAPTFPVASISPTSLAFGNQVLLTASSTQPITLSNTGTATLNITSIATSGDFSIASSACGSTLNASASCILNIRFTPTALGARSGTLSFTDNAAGSPQAVALTGSGVSAPEPIASLSPSSLSFASTFVGVTTAAKDITLTNTGNATLNIASIATSGDFAKTTTCVSTLAAAASCVIHVTFTPTAPGARSGTLSVTDDATGSPQSITLSGTGINTTPAICLSTASLNFGNQPINTNSGTRSINATNCGTSNLVFSGIASSVSNIDDFADAVAPCPLTAVWCGVHDSGTPGTAVGTTTIVTSPALDGHSRQFITTFTAAGGFRWHEPFLLDPTLGLDPNSSQYTYDVQAYVLDTTHVNQLEFAMNQVMSNGNTVIYDVQCNFVAGFWDYTTNVSGAAHWTNSTIPCTKVIWTSAAWHHLVVKYHRDPAGIVTYDSIGFDGSTTAFTNASGNSAFSLGWTPIGLNLLHFQINGDNTSNSATAYLDELSISTGGFSQTNNCTTVVPGAFCTINSMFSPTVVGSIAGQFRISTNAASSPNAISLAGFGTLTGGVLTPTSQDFGSATVGVPTAASTFTFLNTGNTSVTLGAPTLTGTNPSDFAVTTTCGTVAPAASCTMSVVFTAGGAGARSATLNQLVGSSTLTASLTGTGVAVAPVVLLSPTSFDFGNVQQSTPSASTTITLVNSGTANLTLSSVAATGANAADFAVTNHCGGTVLPTENCLIDIVFTPSTTGAETAALTITDNAAGSPHSVALAGAGTAAPAPRVQPSTTSLTFPLTQVGVSSAAQVITVVNLGNSALIFSSITKGGANPGDFILASGGTCTTVAPGANCTIPVNFLPTAAGSRSATLLLADNATGSPQTITLSGTAFVGAPNLLVPISSVDFGNLLVGTTSAPLVFTLTNTGTAAATVSFTVTGDFLESDTCNGSIAISATCAVTLNFAPTVLCGQFDSNNVCTSNVHLGQLSIVSNTVNSPQNVSLKGTALSPTPPPGPVTIGMGGKTGVGGNMRSGVQ